MHSLIISKQISREEAFSILKTKPYNKDTINQDIEYFLKKIKWQKIDLDEYLSRPRKNHNHYKNELYLWEFATKLYRYFK